MDYTFSIQLAVWPVSSGGTETDREVGSDAARSLHPAATFPWKLRTAGTYPVSVWPRCCLAHDLSHTHRHNTFTNTACVPKHAHTHCSTRCVFTWVMSWSWVIELIQRVYRSVDPSGILWTLQPISYHETTHIWAWQIFSFQEWLKTLAEILEKCCRRCN